MIENLTPKIENEQTKVEINDEINIKFLFYFLLRNKVLIGLISFLTLIFGTLYSFTLQKIWEGKFQIVLSSKENSTNINSRLADLAGIGIR